MLSKYVFLLHNLFTFLSFLGLVLDKFYKQKKARVGFGLDRDFNSLMLHLFSPVEPKQHEQRPSLVFGNF